IVVTGTNGKTTTTAMLAAVLRVRGPVVVNTDGANLQQGLVSALLVHTDWFGRLRTKTALFEVDEATLPRVAAVLPIRWVVVTILHLSVKRPAVALCPPSQVSRPPEESVFPQDDHRPVLDFQLPVQVSEEVPDPHGFLEIPRVHHQHVLLRRGHPVGRPVLHRQDLARPEDCARGEGQEQDPAVGRHQPAPGPAPFLRGHGDLHHPQPLGLLYSGQFRDQHG
ncbi:MAG: hypothetical protein K6U07_10235, partial [Firmicutes bacterium]|nr:hypothetical protein [Bacillota bacterium]